MLELYRSPNWSIRAIIREVNDWGIAKSGRRSTPVSPFSFKNIVRCLILLPLTSPSLRMRLDTILDDLFFTRVNPSPAGAGFSSLHSKTKFCAACFVYSVFLHLLSLILFYFLLCLPPSNKISIIPSLALHV